MKLKFRHLYLPLLLAALLALTGCSALGISATTPAPESFQDELEFSSQYTDAPDGNSVITLYMVNTSSRAYPGDDIFNGRMEIRNSDGELRAAADIYQVGPLSPGERRTQLTWEGVLTPGAYTLTWGAEGYSTITNEIQVP